MYLFDKGKLIEFKWEFYAVVHKMTEQSNQTYAKINSLLWTVIESVLHCSTQSTLVRVNTNATMFSDCTECR